MQTGYLVKTMVGEDLSSTDLHLANGDTLLVGQVAELTQTDRSAGPLHSRKLQVSIWQILLYKFEWNCTVCTLYENSEVVG